MLIIALPHTTASEFAFALSDGQSVLRSSSAAAAGLPLHAGEVVAVVPHTRLSWLQVQLPPGSHGARLDAVIQGLLEDRLLDDLSQLLCVLPAEGASQAKAGGPCVVAVCDASWLRQSLAPLQAAGLTVQRLVPDVSPSPNPVLHVIGSPDHAQGLLTHAQGVTPLPPAMAQWQAFAELHQPELSLHAEPAMVEAVQQLFQRQPMLETSAQRWLAAANQTRWNLAQGEWAQGPTQRLQRWLQSRWQALWHDPDWAPLRWGIVGLLVVQLIGLNALAWREQQALTQQQQALPQILQATFAHVSLVVDAPLQMQRELSALMQRSGHASASDFEPLLAALGSVLPTGQTPSQLHFAERVLRVQGLNWSAAESEQASRALHTRGVRLRQEGNDTWSLQAEATP
jgi:general secretion pathway protein L